MSLASRLFTGGFAKRNLAIMVALVFAVSAHAQEASENSDRDQEPTKPLWEVGVVGLAAYLPDYPAADESHVRLFPFPWIVYRGEIFRAEEGQLRGRFVKTDRVEFDISASGSLPVSSDKNDARAGMEDLDWLGEIGPQVKIVLWPQNPEERSARIDFVLPVRGAVSTDFSSFVPDWRGVVAAPALAYKDEDFIMSALNLKLSGSVIFATEQFMDYFYEVVPKDARPGRPVFDADGGYLGSRLSLRLDRPITDTVHAYLNSHFDLFSGAQNEDSPLFRSSTNWGIGIGITWSIFQSDERVRE